MEVRTNPQVLSLAVEYDNGGWKAGGEVYVDYVPSLLEPPPMGYDSTVALFPGSPPAFVTLYCMRQKLVGS